MKNYDDFELNCKDDCDSCEVKLECEYLTADGEAKKAALTKLVERDEKEEAARKAEESAEAADEATEEAEEQTVEEQPVEEITEEVTEENGETVETEEVIDTASPAEELAEAADEATEEAEEQAEEQTVEEITEEVTEENGETVETEEVIDTSSPAEELAEAADEATEEAEEQAEEEKPVEEITEEVTEQNGETVETEEVIDTSSPAEELAEVAEEATEEAEEQAEEETAEEVEESILETAEDIDAPEEEKAEDEQSATEEEPTEEAQTSEIAVQDKVTEEVAEKTDETKNEVAEQTEETTEEQTEQTEEEKPAKSAFKLTPPENLEELYAAMCTKRARKLIFRPAEAIYDKTFKVLGTDKKNEEGIKVKDILDAEIKQGVKLGYIDKFDGLKTSEIKEEYENDVVYEYAEQEFKKVGLIYDGKKIKVYVYDFDGKACHHVGYIDETEAADVIPYLIDKEKYSFALDGIITGGKAKRVTKDENGKITITKEKDGDIGLELDVTIIPRKD